jgi:hypothetical protein
LGQEIVRLNKDQEARAESESLLIFFDWDDTVLPTSFLAAQQIGLDTSVPRELVASFERYAESVASTIRCMKKFGRVVIVTNAEAGWVELTCAKFLPLLVPEISDLQRVSARSEYEPLGFQGPVQWKTEAFVTEAQRHFGDSVQPVVLSVGDANHERVAVHYAAQRLKASARSIKLVERPDLAVLQREHALLQERFPQLQSIPSLDVRLDEI